MATTKIGCSKLAPTHRCATFPGALCAELRTHGDLAVRLLHGRSVPGDWQALVVDRPRSPSTAKGWPMWRHLAGRLGCWSGHRRLVRQDGGRSTTATRRCDVGRSTTVWGVWAQIDHRLGLGQIDVVAANRVAAKRGGAGRSASWRGGAGRSASWRSGAERGGAGRSGAERGGADRPASWRSGPGRSASWRGGADRPASWRSGPGRSASWRSGAGRIDQRLGEAGGTLLGFCCTSTGCCRFRARLSGCRREWPYGHRASFVSAQPG